MRVLFGFRWIPWRWRWLEVDVEIPVPTYNTASVFMVVGSRAAGPACLGTPFPGTAQAVLPAPLGEAVRAGRARLQLTGAMIY